MRSLLIAVILLFSFYANAKPFLLVAEKHSEIGIEQASIMIEGNSLRLTQNSDFLSAELPIYYGIFRTKPTPQVLKAISDLQKAKFKSPSEAEHIINVYLNGKSVDSHSPVYKKSLDLLRKLVASKAWRLDKGEIIDKQNMSKIMCSKVQNGVCIFNYGIIHLR